MVAGSSLVAEVEGNMGQITKQILLDLFCSRRASPFMDLGVVLQGPSTSDRLTLFFRFAIFIQDGASRKLTVGQSTV